MLWAITADLQFDDQPRYSKPRPDGITSRLHDTLECFEWIVETAITDHGAEGLLILGDVFDARTTISLSVLDRACRAVHAAADRLFVHVLVGNHDSMLRVPTVNSTQVFRGMAQVHETPTVVGPFAFLPWVEDDDTMSSWVAQLAAHADARFLFAHTLLEGAVPMGAGRPVALLQPDRWEQVILGDVHEPVVLRDNVRYCGAPLQIHFGDAGGVRGFYLLDDESGEVTFVENVVSPRFHKIEAVEDLDDVEVLATDFVRVVIQDHAEAVAVAEQLTEASWLEVTAVEDVEDGPRLSLGANDADREIVRAWLSHMDLDGADGVEDLAVELLHEARSS